MCDTLGIRPTHHTSSDKMELLKRQNVSSEARMTGIHNWIQFIRLEPYYNNFIIMTIITLYRTSYVYIIHRIHRIHTYTYVYIVYIYVYIVCILIHRTSYVYIVHIHHTVLQQRYYNRITSLLQQALASPAIQFIHILNMFSLTYGTSPAVYYYYYYYCQTCNRGCGGHFYHAWNSFLNCYLMSRWQIYFTK